MMCIACPQHTKTDTITDAAIGLGGIATGTNSTFSFHSFQEGKETSKTKCIICGREKWQHPQIAYT
jgi:hypothetical protein